MFDLVHVWIEQVRSENERVGMLMAFLVMWLAWNWKKSHFHKDANKTWDSGVPVCMGQHHHSSKETREFPVDKNTSNTVNVLLWATCVNGQLQTISRPISPDIVLTSYEKSHYSFKNIPCTIGYSWRLWIFWICLYLWPTSCKTQQLVKYLYMDL